MIYVCSINQISCKVKQRLGKNEVWDYLEKENKQNVRIDHEKLRKHALLFKRILSLDLDYSLNSD